MTTRARRAREKEERRQSILRAAREAFIREGFHRATVETIAERAEVSKGTVYLYFESKETILAHLLLEGLETLIGLLAEAYGVGRSLSAEERLRRIGWAYLQFFQREPLYFRFLMAVDRGGFRESVTRQVYEEVLAASLEGLDWVVRAIQQGVDDGSFDCRDSRQAAATLWATLNGVLELMDHSLRREIVGVGTDVLYRTALDTIIRGLRREPVAPTAIKRLEEV